MSYKKERSKKKSLILSFRLVTFEVKYRFYFRLKGSNFKEEFWNLK